MVNASIVANDTVFYKHYDICEHQCFNVSYDYLADPFDDELLVNDVILGLFDKLIFGCDIRLVFTGCGVSTFLAPS